MKTFPTFHNSGASAEMSSSASEEASFGKNTILVESRNSGSSVGADRSKAPAGLGASPNSLTGALLLRDLGKPGKFFCSILKPSSWRGTGSWGAERQLQKS